MKTCIFVVIKDEQEYIEDFIRYHINLGIDTLFIFEDIDSTSHKSITDKYKQLTFGRSDYNFWSHFSLSTNFVDWALVIPNIGLDIDFGNPNRKSTSSIYLQFKGSPSSKDYLKEKLKDKKVSDEYSYDRASSIVRGAVNHPMM